SLHFLRSSTPFPAGQIFSTPLNAKSLITGIWWIVDAFLIPGIIQGHAEQTRRDARLEVAALQVAGASVSHPQD
ncbi:hypothetical protein QOZ67_04000, partial [Pseudomonas aeruginosa]